MNIIQAFQDALRPVKKVTCDVWADQNIVLTSENSVEPGKWSTSRTPYLREILENLSPTSPVREIIFAKGVQIGATASGLICMLTYVDTDPCGIMYVLPTIEVCEAFSKDKLQPMIDNCAALSSKIRSARDRDSGNTILAKRFPGGFIVMAGANSAASLRSRSVRVLVLDETDAFVKNLDKEGSPIALAEKRTSSFGDKKKIFKLSTPTVKSASVITTEFERTEQRYYHVPCPHCGTAQYLKFDRLRWTEGKPETVKYSCEHCEELIEERHKTRMMDAGFWKATVPDLERRARRGYHLSTLYSPYGWKSWEEIADEYEKALETLGKGDHNNMRTFYNTILGEAYEEGGDAPEWQSIFNRREHYDFNKPNAEVCFLTAGVDVQKDRLEVEIVGWGKGKRSWSIDYRVLVGETSGPEVWDDLAKILTEVWVTENEVEMPIRLMAVDSGFNTTHVYNFCKRFNERQVVPVKGDFKQNSIFSTPKAVNRNAAGKEAGNVRLFGVNTDMLKTEFYGYLKLFKGEDDEIGPPGYCHFPQYSENHFKGLTAEVLKTSYSSGYAVTKWEKTFMRNEQLDCRNYARAAAAIIGMDRNSDEWIQAQHDVYVKKTLPPPKPIEEVSITNKKGSFWD